MLKISKTSMAIRGALAGVCVVGGSLMTATAQAAPTAEALIGAKCLSCHVETAEGVSRISYQRKSPEGWLMSIVRMQVLHGLKITADERQTLVKHLADKQGLAPEETAGARYILERRLNTQEAFATQEFTEMCARCHSGARVLLQRRPAAEWEHLVHFHLGQYPTTEYQQFGRDRDWLGMALEVMVPQLARDLPLESTAWQQWQGQPAQPVGGDWVVSGHKSGQGGFSGVMKVVAGKDDRHTLSFEGRWDDGTAMKGKGQALVYTGYEWRGDLEIDGVAYQQVLMLKDGMLEGRMFEREHEEIGVDFVASRSDGGDGRVLAAHPAYLKAGTEAELRIVGSDLKGELALPPGVSVLETLKTSANEIVVRVRTDQDATGVHPLRVGKANGAALALYDRIAGIKVLPEVAVARVGSDDSSTPKVSARFDAEAWAAGADGKYGTEDDYRIGVVSAKWSVEPFDEAAERDQDVRFAGVMDDSSGVFIPGGAGSNPQRRLMGTNVGNLKVVASVEQEGSALQGEGQLFVAPQRWNNPPIR